MVMRKIALIMFLVISFIAMPFNLFATEEIVKDVFIYYGDADSFGRGRGDWSVPNQSEGTYIEKTTIDGEDSFHIYAGEDGDKINAMLYLSQPKRNECKSFVIQFKMRYDNISSMVNSTADAGPNPNWHFFDYFSLDSAGVMSVGGRNITTIQSGKFYEYAFLTDLVAKKYEMYINGSYIGNFSFDSNYNYLAEYSLLLEGKSGGSHLYIADFSVYEADAVASFSEIEAAYEVKKNNVSMCPMADEVEKQAEYFSLFAADAAYVHHNGKREKIKVPFIYENNILMAPVICTADIFGAESSSNDKCVQVSFNGKNYTFSLESDSSFDLAIIKKDGIIYAQADKFLSIFANVYLSEEYPFIAVGDGDFNGLLTERIDIREMYYYLMYERPGSSQVLSDFKKTSEDVHPRIYYSKDKVDKIKELAKTDADIKEWYQRQINDAEKSYGLDVIKLIKSDSELNTSYSGDITSFSKLAFAYMMTGEGKWADDLWRVINGFMEKNEDLNHRRSFLNGSEAARQIALSYDWAYDYFTNEQKDKIEKFLFDTTFEPWMRAHQGMVGFPSSSYAYKSQSNINCVLSSQIGVAAMAVFEKNPQFYSKLMAAIFRQMEYFLPCYAPDGGYWEGTSYWEYATTNLVKLFEATESTFGTLYGMYDVFNVKNTGEFPLYMNGDKLQFNFGDGYRSSLIGDLPTSYYFALKNGDREFAKTIIDLMREAGYPIGNRWYDPAFPSAEGKSFSLDRYFRDVEAGSMRERWTSNSAYLAYHGGDNSIGHGDLDIGTFVFDAYGKRWAEELGSDNYDYDQYFGNKRYLYYKKRGEGQNVLLINPYGKYEDQKKDAYSTLICSNSGEMGAYAVLDTSGAYGENVTKATRGFMLTDGRKEAIIRDEVTLTRDNNELYWFMHTMAENIEITDEGKTAVLSIGRHRCIMQLSSSEDAMFEIMEPVHLAENTKPSKEQLTDLSGTYKKIMVHLSGAEGKVYINVCMRVTDITDEKMMPVNIDLPIENWNSVYDKDYENPIVEDKVFFTVDEKAILYPINDSEIFTDKAYISVAGANVKSADIYVDEKLIGNFMSPPFGKSVALSDGEHTIKAEYKDIYGESHTVYSNISVVAKYRVINERRFDFEDFERYESETQTYKIFKDSLFISEYGTASDYAYAHITDTDPGYGKSFFSETITGDTMGFGLTDWGDTWREAVYVEYDFLCSDFENRRIEIYSPQCAGERINPYIIQNGKLIREEKEVFTFENSKWYKISILLDSALRRISIYINGECVVENDYVENLSGVMRPGYILLGSYIPNSVIIVDNYTTVNLDRKDGIIIKTDAENEKIVYSFIADNKESTEKETVLAAAIYKDEKLHDVKIIRKKIPLGINEISGEVPFDVNGKTFKMFFVDTFFGNSE